MSSGSGKLCRFYTISCFCLFLSPYFSVSFFFCQYICRFLLFFSLSFLLFFSLCYDYYVCVRACVCVRTVYVFVCSHSYNSLDLILCFPLIPLFSKRDGKKFVDNFGKKKKREKEVALVLNAWKASRNKHFSG